MRVRSTIEISENLSLYALCSLYHNDSALFWLQLRCVLSIGCRAIGIHGMVRGERSSVQLRSLIVYSHSVLGYVTQFYVGMLAVCHFSSFPNPDAV